jgi:hypothetical protein
VTNDQTNPGRAANACGPSESANYVVTGDAQPTDSANSGGVYSVEFGTCAEPVGLSVSAVAWTPTVDTNQQDTDGEADNTLSQSSIDVDGIATMENTNNLKGNRSLHSTDGGGACNGRLISLQQPSGNGSGTTHLGQTSPDRRNRII